MKFSDMSLCKLLNLKMPVFQAPMGGAVTPKFASCIANHGVLAMLPLGNWLIESCEKLIDSDKCQKLMSQIVNEYDFYLYGKYDKKLKINSPDSSFCILLP